MVDPGARPIRLSVRDLTAAALLALAMGAQNAAVPQIAGAQVNTVFVSGDIVRFGQSLVGSKGANRNRTLLIMADVWLSYVLSASLGALATQSRVPIMLVPAGALILACLRLPQRPRAD